MKPTATRKQKQVLPRIKIHFELGRSLTALEALHKYGTMRLAEYVRVLRHDHGMKIEKKMVEYNGKHFAEYWLPKQRKVDRIKTRQYLNQA
jgi:hypothetical protein